MSELGNIYQPVSDGPKGPDLHVSVRPPLPVEGVRTQVSVPLDLPHEGALVRRADPHGDGERIALGIPPGLSPGTTLRLRGAGGVPTEAGGVAGDLYITVEGFESPSGLADLARGPVPRAALLVVGAVAVLFAIAWSWAG